ncbi:MAG: hypothetical protein Q9207_006597, partial [Kuettlingeria erythrocarpa]
STLKTCIANKHAAAEKKNQVTHLENLKRKCLKAGKKVASASTGPSNTTTTTGGGRGRGGRKGSGFGGMLRRGSWTTGGGKGKKGSLPPDGRDSPLGSPGRVPVGVNVDNGDGEDEAAVEEVEGVDGTDLTPTTTPTTRRSSISTLLKRTMSIGSKNPVPGSSGSGSGNGGSRRNSYDFGQPAVRPSLAQSPVGSYSSSEVKGKGKAVLRRRGSGR